MSYEYLVNTFGLANVRWCVDYRTGSSYEMKGPVASTTVGTCRLNPGGGLLVPVFSGAGHYLHYGDTYDVVNTQSAFSVIAIVRRQHAQDSAIVSKGTANPYWFLEMYAGTQPQLTLFNAAGTSLSVRSTPVLRLGDRHIVIVTYDGSLLAAGVRLYQDGNPAALTTVTNTLVAGSLDNASNLAIGGYSATGMHGDGETELVAWLDTAITGPQAATLYAELARQRAAKSRPYREFAPYPKRDAAGYAAEGITCDVPAERPNGSGTDLATTIRASVLPGAGMDACVDGPFGQSLLAPGINGKHMGFPATVGDQPAGVSSWSLELWMTQPNVNATQPAARANVAAPYWFLNYNVPNQLAIFTSTGGVPIAMGANLGAGTRGKWYHIFFTYEAGAFMRFFFNGQQATAPISVATQITTFQNALNQLHICNDSSPGTTAANNAFAMFRAYNRLVSPTEVRERFIDGAVACMFDGRLPRDGSCPVGLSVIASSLAEIPGTPYTLYTYVNARVMEDAPSGVRPGKRWLVGTSAFCGTASDRSAPYGCWYVQFNRKGGNALRVFIGQRPGPWLAIANQNGYVFTCWDSVTLARISAGVSTTIFQTGNILSQNTDYELFFWRTYLGSFQVWLRGGAYTSWTLLPAAVGTNPVTDNTHTTAGWISVNPSSSVVQVGDVMHFLGEMNPDEAVRAGAAPGSTFILFSELTTTDDMNQTHVVRATLGSPYYLDYGDGTEAWFTGTGADQSVGKVYGTLGAYKMRLYLSSVAQLQRYWIISNHLSGACPNFTGCSALTSIDFYDNVLTGACNSPTDSPLLTFFGVAYNGFTGRMPDFSANPALYEIQLYVNQFSGEIRSLAANPALAYAALEQNLFTGSIPSLAGNPALIYFGVSGNLLTGSIPSLAANVNLEEFYVDGNQLTGTIPSLTTNIVLNTFWVQDNVLTGYTASVLASTLVDFEAQGNALTEAAVDQILADFLVGAAGRPAIGTIDLSGGTNSPPSAAGLATIAAFLAIQPAWTITVNP